MPNGIRWSKVPIAIIVEDDEIRRRTYGDPALRTITVASAYSGWDNVYKTVAKAVNAFGMQLVDEYRSAGWKIAEEHGRYIRVEAPRGKRRDGKVEHIETDTYTGAMISGTRRGLCANVSRYLSSSPMKRPWNTTLTS